MRRFVRTLSTGLLLCAALVAASSLGEDLARARATQQKGSFAEARNEFQRALTRATQLADTAAVATSVAGLAQADLALGHYADAVREATDAVTKFRALINKAEEARILTTLGQAQFYAGDPAGALGNFEQSLTIARAMGDREGEVTRLNNIGNIHYSEGRYGEALARYRLAEQRAGESKGESWFRSRSQLTSANLAVLYQRLGQYKQALAIYTSMGADPKALPGPERAQMLANIGTLYRRLGDGVAAIENYRAAQDIYRKNAVLSGEVGVLNNIGIAQTLDLGNPRAAVGTFTEALRMADKSRGRRLMMTSLLYRGEALLRANDAKGASADFGSAEALATELKADEERWRADYGLARAAVAVADRGRANELLHRSIGIIENMRAATSAAAGRAGFLIDRREVYDLLIAQEASAERPDPAAIFRLMEDSRAGDLRDRTGGQVVGLSQLQGRLPADALLLEYWMGEWATAVIAVSKTQAKLVYRPLAAGDLDALLGLPARLADPRQQHWEAAASVAAGVLLKDVTGSLGSGIQRVIVVPDGNLARIPFEALPIGGDGRELLIDRVSVSYLPFASAFRAGDTRRGVLPPWRRLLMAFADPPGGGSGDLTAPGEGNIPLPQAAREVRNASEELGGASDLFVGENARKAQLTRAQAPVPVMHFATHAFADPDDPDRSYILLARESGRSQGFDYLFLREAAGIGAARGSLVVVSACDSGTGRITRGEGVQSFASAFLAAGARGVLTSLWRVGDRPTEELMTRFYAALAAGGSAEDALRSAKLAFRRSAGTAAHPAYWAGFVLAGDGGTRIPHVFSWKAAAAVVLAVAALFSAILAGLKKIRTRAETV